MDDFKNNLPESDHAGFAPPQNDATPTSTPANDAAAASAANPFQQPALRMQQPLHRSQKLRLLFPRHHRHFSSLTSR